MKKTTLQIFLYSFTIATVFGQGNQVSNKSGMATPMSYVLKNSGDTLRGKITLKFGNQSVKNIVFKGPSGKNEKYGPKEIKEIFINGTLFKSKIIPFDKSSGEFAPDIDTVFVEILARADVDLLYYQDERHVRHFYFESKGQLEELVLKMIHKENFNDQPLELYKGQLKLKFKQCPSLFATIDNLPFERVKMQQLFVKGCECTGQNLFMTSVRQKKFKMKWGLAAGLSVFIVGGFIWATKDHYDPSL